MGDYLLLGEVVEVWGVWVVGVVAAAVDVVVVVDAAVVAAVVVAAASAVVVVVAVGAVAAADFDRKLADVVVAAAVHAEGVGLEV